MFDRSNISETKEASGSQLGSHQPQTLGDGLPPPATISAAKPSIKPHRATCGDPLDVPSKQRVAGSNPARRTSQNPRSAATSVGRCLIFMKPSGASVPAACPIGSGLTDPGSPRRACSGHQRWRAGAHLLRAGRSSRHGPWSGPFGPSARAGLPRSWRPACYPYDVDHDYADVGIIMIKPTCGLCRPGGEIPC